MSVRKELPCPSSPKPRKPNYFPKVLEKSKEMPNNLHRRKLITDSHVKRLTLNAVFVNKIFIQKCNLGIEVVSHLIPLNLL